MPCIPWHPSGLPRRGAPRPLAGQWRLRNISGAAGETGPPLLPTRRNRPLRPVGSGSPRCGLIRGGIARCAARQRRAARTTCRQQAGMQNATAGQAPLASRRNATCSAQGCSSLLRTVKQGTVLNGIRRTQMLCVKVPLWTRANARASMDRRAGSDRKCGAAEMAKAVWRWSMPCQKEKPGGNRSRRVRFQRSECPIRRRSRGTIRTRWPRLRPAPASCTRSTRSRPCRGTGPRRPRRPSGRLPSPSSCP